MLPLQRSNAPNGGVAHRSIPGAAALGRGAQLVGSVQRDSNRPSLTAGVRSALPQQAAHSVGSGNGAAAVSGASNQSPSSKKREEVGQSQAWDASPRLQWNSRREAPAGSSLLGIGSEAAAFSYEPTAAAQQVAFEVVQQEQPGCEHGQQQEEQPGSRLRELEARLASLAERVEAGKCAPSQGAGPCPTPASAAACMELLDGLRRDLEAETTARVEACRTLEAHLAQETQRWGALAALGETAGQAAQEDKLGWDPAAGEAELEPHAASAALPRALEARWRAQLEAAAGDLQVALQGQLQAQQREAQRLHQEAMEQEVKEREEICHMLLTYLEDKVQEERQRLDQKLQEEQREREEQLQQLLQQCERDLASQRQSTHKALQDGLQEERKRCEEGLCASEQVVQTHLSSLVNRVEEQAAQELLNARQSLLQSLLELRQELSDGLRVEREAREQVSVRLSSLERPLPDWAEDRLADWRGLEEQHARLREALESQESRLSSLQNDLYRELEKTASQSREVLGALGSTRGALGACRDEVAGLRDGLEHLREQAEGRVAADESAAEAAGGAREAEAVATAERLRAAVDTEARLREEADDRLLAQTRELAREERQAREQGQRALELGVHSVKELLFIDSGKREERDRDIQIQLAKIDEDLDTVRRQLALRAR